MTLVHKQRAQNHGANLRPLCCKYGAMSEHCEQYSAYRRSRIWASMAMSCCLASRRVLFDNSVHVLVLDLLSGSML